MESVLTNREILEIVVALIMAMPLFFVLQMLINWTVRLAGIDIMPLQGNFLAILTGCVIIGVYTLLVLGERLWVFPLEASMCLLFVILTLMGFSYTYFATFAISEVSLHMHIMLMVLVHGELSTDAIKARYHKTYMLEERLNRLVKLGQVRVDDGVYHLNGRYFLYGSKIFDIWKMLLGFPTKLEKV